MSQENKVTRRSFLKGAAAVGATVAAGGLLAAPAQAAPVPTSWDKETDVLVVGYGGAGAVAAITAVEQGAKVLVIEKSPQRGQSNTATASGHIGYPQETDEKATAASFAKSFQAESGGLIDDETAKGLSESWMLVPKWLADHGIPFKAGYIDLGPDMISLWDGKKTDGSIGTSRDLMGGYNKVVDKLGIEVLLSTPAKRLIQDPVTKEILGVIAESGGKPINIKAKRAVVMACGGFEASREMMANYVNECPVPISARGTPYNTGDGIKMVLEVGAELWHMRNVEWSRDGIKPEGFPAAFWLDFKETSYVVVNKAGKRFKDESVTYGHAKKPLEVFANVGETWPNTPCYYVFDDKTRLAGPILMLARGVGRSSVSTYNIATGLFKVSDWSKDNSEEIKKGWIKQGSTLAELAGKIGVDAKGLEATVAKYNEYCKNGADPELFRAKATLKPVDKAPYYAVEIALNTINTQGGPKRNGKCQVMTPFGQPVPRLYSGGEFGSWNGQLYQCSNLGEGIASGTVAGKNAAAEKPWDAKV